MTTAMYTKIEQKVNTKSGRLHGKRIC
jgi:hypothetical protein